MTRAQQNGLRPPARGKVPARRPRSRPARSPGGGFAPGGLVSPACYVLVTSPRALWERAGAGGRDQKVLADRIAEGLRDQGWPSTWPTTASGHGEPAFTRYDVIVLDRDLPRVHGDAVCASLVAGRAQARILMLTAATAVEDQVDGSTSAPTTTSVSRSPSPYWSRGSAHWPPQPVRAAGGEPREPRHRPGAPQASRGRRPMTLTKKEFGVLEELLAADGGVVAPRSCWNACGTSTPIRSAIPSRSRCPGCAASSAPAADRNGDRQRLPVASTS